MKWLIKFFPSLYNITPREQLTYMLVVLIIFYHIIAVFAELLLNHHSEHTLLHIMIVAAYGFFTLYYIRHKNFTLSIYAILTASSLYFLMMLYLTNFALYSYFFPILLPIGTYIILSLKESILFIILHYATLTLVSLYGYMVLGIESEAFTFIALKVYVFIVTFIFLFGMVYHITLRKNYQMLSDDNHKKEVALSEIHHRVKNDLNLISSMLSVHHFGAAEAQDKGHVVESNKARIDAIAIIHELLYKENNFESIRFEKYVESLGNSLLTETKINCTLDVKTQNICFPIKHMQHLGIIINELILTSLYHTLDQTSISRIEITLIDTENMLRLTYRDNASLCDMKKIHSENALGIEFAKASAKQLGASISFECNNGFVCHVAMNSALQTPCKQSNGHV